ncbi:MAG: bifunctional DNA primase/polymerase [Microbacterium sp.]|uniref:bifunctional DNA primase/polymerase n=1 Tax=Microbacterium sp. TaxID=51671 RepID=UPI001AD51ECE|nr:bifunctional DNA primase/polymerase [Microbacterium sp.]MBN9178774.1 bifunctional DNA primase/polymerase [Microbacterium sp.]
MDTVELFASVSDLSLPEAAAWFAAVGVPVFPCVPDGKRPLVEHGFHDAATDAGQVAAWWRRWPTANIGVPTGAASGVEVVDVDRKAAGSGFAAFGRARQAGLVGAWLAVVRTPSGGMHAYFPTDPDRPQASWQAARAHVDFRGAGGYIIAPPSVVNMPGGPRPRARYELIGGAQPGAAPLDAMALRDFLDPRPPLVVRRSITTRVEDAERLAAWVSALGEGERNRGLFWAACRMAEAGASPAATLDTLSPAAERAGLPPREVAVTIRSAYRTIRTAPTRTASHAPGHDEAPHRAARVDSQVLS